MLKEKHPMPAVIILIVLIAADQLLKWWTVSHLALGSRPH